MTVTADRFVLFYRCPVGGGDRPRFKWKGKLKWLRQTTTGIIQIRVTQIQVMQLQVLQIMEVRTSRA
jgi:hypothetical protein